MWIPAGFRFTCYYYRGAYYKAFWADPIACTVGEPRKTYLGERYFPLILQNVHRYFLYLALAFIFILGRDALDALWFTDSYGAKHFGLALGSLVLIINVGSSRRIHARLPFVAPFGWRLPRFPFPSTRPAQAATTPSAV